MGAEFVRGGAPDVVAWPGARGRDREGAKRALLSSDWHASTSSPVRSLCDCAELKVGGREKWRRQSVNPTLGVVFLLKQPVTGRCSSGYDLRNESPAARRVGFSSLAQFRNSFSLMRFSADEKLKVRQFCCFTKLHCRAYPFLDISLKPQ